MNYKIGRSSKKDINEAVSEATLGLTKPKLIMFFSGVENFEQYTSELQKRFEGSVIIGATTFAAFCSEGSFKENIMVLGVNEGIECYGDVLEDADKFPIKCVERICGCIKKLSDTSNTVCFEVANGLINCEEIVLSTLNAVLNEKDIPLFGGTAGDKGKAEKTLISFNGKVYNNAAAFVIIKNLNGKISLYKENIYKPTGHYFNATKVDLRSRTVYEFDNKPALEVVADALGTITNDVPKYLDSYPLGRIVGKDLYIIANKGAAEKNAMSYHARIYKNSHMVLLEPDDYKKVNEETIKKIQAENKNPSLSIMVNCLARSILFESDGYLDTFCKKMGAALGNYIGFAGYGEQLNDQHCNQTMVVAVFE